MRRVTASLLGGPLLLVLALVAPTSVAAAGPISSAACTATGPGAVSCDLWAKSGTLSLPGATTPIWGFASSAGGTAGVPGPVLIVDSGDSVTLNLTNMLTVTTSILFDGQPMAPDLTGVAAGATKTYTFTAGDPGTYLYEAGLLPGSQYQVAKGLYGALIVRPAGAAMQANDSPATLFADEALVVLGEVDTSLNASSNPATFDLRAFNPRYFLINGKAYPQTAPITTTAGNRLLVRYLNAGLRHHSMGVLGLRQTVVTEDGSALAFPRHMVAESLAPGEGIDVLIDLPGTTAASTRHLLYDASMGLNNTTGTGSNAGIGGMLAVIDAAGTPVGGDTVGPLTTNVAMDPDTGSLTATVSDGATGGSSVNAAEYFIDTIGPAGSGTPLTGTFPSDPATVSATLAPVPAGSHTVYLRGQDGLGNWGPTSSTSFALDAVGPATTGATINPTVSNGTTSVTIAATANDTATGGSTIQAAEYFVDTVGADGSGTAMTIGTPSAAVSSVSSTLSGPALAALSAGDHLVSIHSQDSRGNWGPTTTTTLTIDATGPIASAVGVSPTPNNGTRGINSSTPMIRVTATLDDVSPAFVKTAEVFIDTVVGTGGAGIPMAPADGLFNAAHELAYVDIPLTTVAQLSNGDHPIFVRGKDSAGNWGATSSTTLVVDKAGPTTSGITMVPPAANAQAVALSATGNDVASGNNNVVAGEYFIDSVGSNGTGTAMTVASPSPTATMTATIPATTIAGLSTGNHTLYVHARDLAGAWGTRVSVVLKIDRTAPTFSSASLTPNSIASGTATTTLNVNGANDGATGSGVVGGEFWIANSNVPPGGGTAFSGTTASVPTGALVPGTYTVRVRIRDAAQNWSTGTNGVRTATLTVTGPVPAAIFSDGFELETVPGTWSRASTTSSTRLKVTSSAALSGSRGLQAQGNNTNYVQYNFGTAASPATRILDAKFLFRPNAKSTSGQDIFSAATNSGFGTRVLRVRYRLSGGIPQVQIQVGSANTNTTWSTITGGSFANTIEVVRESVGSGGPNPGTLRLYVNGVLVQALTTTSTASVGAFRLGAVTSGGGSSTAEYFDGFASKRTATPYGP